MEQDKHNTQKKKWQQLTLRDRYKIEVLYKQGLTPNQIAQSFEPKRDRRTIEHELTKRVSGLGFGL